MKNCLLFCFALLPFFITAQETRDGAPNIFLDCQWWCDLQFLKTELGYVNFMRDRADADVFIQQTGLSTGSGGTQYTLFFYGQKKKFEGQNDTLVFNTAPAASEGDIRNALKANIERGLLPYLLQTPLAERISFSVKADEEKPDSETSAAPVRDPWNFWTFSLNGTFEANGQEVYKSRFVSAGLSANRVTERSKTSLFANIANSRNKYEFEEGEAEVFEQNTYSAGGSQIFAINNHWSWGLFGRAGQYQYSNLKISALLAPGIEYNVFPYKDATTRQLTAQYRVGPRYHSYFDTTIFFKKQELLWTHTLSASYNQVLQWGSFNMGANASNYLHDWGLNSVNIFGGISLNLFKGFRLDLFGEYGILRNQIELPKGGASKEEALLRIRQLKTGYNYFMWCSVSYTFGSIYSNVVNPRFGNGGVFF